MAFLKSSLACVIMAFLVLNLNLNPIWPDIIHLIIKSGVGAFAYCAVTYLLNPADIRQFIISKI